MLALLLALILGFASQTEAVARAEMAGATMSAACGSTMVMIDATGKPLVGHDCATHCLAAAAVAATLPGFTLAAPSTAARALRPEALRPGLSQPRPAAQARGPPDLL